MPEKKKEKEKNDFDARYMQRKFNRNNVKFQLLEVAPGNEKTTADNPPGRNPGGEAKRKKQKE